MYERNRPLTLLVLGASGFLGAQVIRRAALRASSRWGRPVAASRSEPVRAEPTTGTEATPRWLAWSAEDAVSEVLGEVRPSAVVNCAAASRVGTCERDPQGAQELNARLPERWARACAAEGVRFVHVSTDLVFGAEAPPPGGFREEATPAPLQRYGESKAEGEARVLASSPGALVVRLPLLYGDSLGRGLGASDGLFDALDRGERPLLFSDEFRTPLDVEVAAEALLELAERTEVGLLHVAGPQRLSRLELAHGVLARRGDDRGGRLLAGLRSELGLEDERPADCSLDASRARARLDSLARAAPLVVAEGGAAGPAGSIGSA